MTILCSPWRVGRGCLVGRLNVPGRVSVVVSVLNGERFIGNCLQSLIDQSYKDVEIVVVDGGSTDRTLEYATDVLSGCNREYLIYHTNGPERYTPMGLMWGFQVGAGNSTGQFISFMGDDDLSHPERFRLLVEAIGAAPVAHSCMYDINERGVIIGGPHGGEANEGLYNAVVLRTEDGCPIHVTGFSCMFRKSTYFSQGCYQIGSYFWECATTLRMYAAGDFVFVPDSILYLRYWSRQGKADTYKGAIAAGYDANELMFGEYNYAIDSDMRREVSAAGLSVAYEKDGKPQDLDWSELLGLFVGRHKRMARRRFE